MPKNDRIPEIVTAGLPTTALRMPDNQLALALVRESGVPIAAPSANPFGYISPTTAKHVREQLGEEVEIVLDGGTCRVGVESTIVSFVDKQQQNLRKYLRHNHHRSLHQNLRKYLRLSLRKNPR